MANKIIGDMQSVEGVESGSFIPGVYRANPVIMQKSASTCSEGYLYSAYDTARTYYTSVKGQFACRMSTDFSYPSRWSAGSTWLDDLVMTRALAKLSATEFDAGLFAAEIGQTVKLLRNPLSSLLDMTKKILRSGGSTNLLGKLASGASGQYLSYRYGLMPLMMDIEAALRLLKTDLAGKSGKLMSKTARRTVEFSNTESFSLAANYDTWKVNVDGKYEDTCTVHIYYRMTHPFTTAQLLGLDVRNIPGFVWEMTGYSFVADWLANLGDVLSAMALPPNIEIVGAVVTHKLKENLSATTADPVYAYTCHRVHNPSVYKRTTERLVRTVVQPNNVKPSFGVNREALSLLHVVDGIALTWQLIAGRS